MLLNILRKIRNRIFGTRVSASSFQFSIDVVEPRAVAGWVRLPSSSERCVVELREGSKVVAREVANILREDLVVAGIGDGQYGFHLDPKMGVFDVRPREFMLFANGIQISSEAIVVEPLGDDSVKAFAGEVEARVEALLAIHSERIIRELENTRAK